MPETPTAAELVIPTAAIRATYGDPLTEDSTNKTTRRILELGSPAVVAAELRRIADELDEICKDMREIDDRTLRSSALATGVRTLRARADELDPPARKED
jgi:hypothetical protein